MEIEIRAQVADPKKLLSTLKKHDGVILEKKTAEQDIYFKHASDKDRKLVLRIRRTKKGDTLTFKAKSSGKDTAWPDIDLPLHDAKHLESILRNNDYEEVVTITKNRTTFRYGTFEINVDQIVELGWFVEIEGRGTEKTREKLEARLTKTLEAFGVGADTHIHQGYVPLALAAKKK